MKFYYTLERKDREALRKYLRKNHGEGVKTINALRTFCNK